MRISDWSSDVCSSDLGDELARLLDVRARLLHRLHVPRQVLHRLAAAPLGKAARLVAGERNLGSQREHVRRKPPVQGGFEVEVLAADIQDAVQGIELRLEDARQFGDRKSVVEGMSVSGRVDSGVTAAI